MKVTKYRIGLKSKTHEQVFSYFKSEQAAKDYLKNWSMCSYLGPEEIDMYCESCNEDLKLGDNYIKIDEHTRYCSDCYKQDTRIVYSVDDEYYDDEQAEQYDEETVEE